MAKATITRVAGQRCVICGKALEVGKPGVQAASCLRSVCVGRVHPSCYKRRLKLARDGGPA